MPRDAILDYERIIKRIRGSRLLELPGDLLEIGTLLGGGAAELAGMLLEDRSAKRVFVNDIFDPNVDITRNTTGSSMTDLYASAVSAYDPRLTQREIFDRVVAEYPNIVVIAGDSKQVELPISELCFAVIDGCHDPSYVRSDFRRAWALLTPGGVVAMHDYGGDLPHVTAAIDEVRAEADGEIAAVDCDRDHWMIYLTKRLK